MKVYTLYSLSGQLHVCQGVTSTFWRKKLGPSGQIHMVIIYLDTYDAPEK